MHHNVFMPVLYPVVSPLHNKEAVESIVKTYFEKLKCKQVPKVPREGVVLVLVCTGGTEHQIVEAAKINPHILLLAHKEQNSLPAALEALAGLKSRCIHSKIIFGLDNSSLTELRNGIKIFETV